MSEQCLSWDYGQGYQQLRPSWTGLCTAVGDKPNHPPFTVYTHYIGSFINNLQNPVITHKPKKLKKQLGTRRIIGHYDVENSDTDDETYGGNFHPMEYRPTGSAGSFMDVELKQILKKKLNNNKSSTKSMSSMQNKPKQNRNLAPNHPWSPANSPALPRQPTWKQQLGSAPSSAVTNALTVNNAIVAASFYGQLKSLPQAEIHGETSNRPTIPRKRIKPARYIGNIYWVKQRNLTPVNDVLKNEDWHRQRLWQSSFNKCIM